MTLVGLLPCVGEYVPLEPGRSTKVFAAVWADGDLPSWGLRLVSVLRKLYYCISAVLKQERGAMGIVYSLPKSIKTIS